MTLFVLTTSRLLGEITESLEPNPSSASIKGHLTGSGEFDLSIEKLEGKYEGSGRCFEEIS